MLECLKHCDAAGCRIQMRMDLTKEEAEGLKSAGTELSLRRTAVYGADVNRYYRENQCGLLRGRKCRAHQGPTAIDILRRKKVKQPHVCSAHHFPVGNNSCLQIRMNHPEYVIEVTQQDIDFRKRWEEEEIG